MIPYTTCYLYGFGGLLSCLIGGLGGFFVLCCFLLDHQVVDVQCRSPVKLLPGAGPADCQISQIQQAVCRVKSSDNHTCFFLVLSLSTPRRIPTSTGSRGLIVPEISSDAS